jgi:hypothetical protein
LFVVNSLSSIRHGWQIVSMANGSFSFSFVFFVCKINRRWNFTLLQSRRNVAIEAPYGIKNEKSSSLSHLCPFALRTQAYFLFLRPPALLPQLSSQLKESLSSYRFPAFKLNAIYLKLLIIPKILTYMQQFTTEAQSTHRYIV